MAKKGKVGRKSAPKVVAKAPAVSNGTIPLKKICQEFGIEPKRARVKLRRALRNKENPRAEFHSIGSRWDLTAAQAKEVRAILG